MKAVEDLIPWKVTDISIRPYEGFWSMNPSIHFDGETWRCVLRCCDYAMPDGVTVRSKNTQSGQQSKNAMVIFDPRSWRAIEIFKMHEEDSLPREPCAHTGYEDMRLFRTDKGGLQGIAATLHLQRDREKRTFVEGTSQHQPPEQVLLTFDDRYDIVDAYPIRGEGWSGTPQKNWVPFDHCVEPRFLYSIDKGRIFGARGALHGEDATVRPSIHARPTAALNAVTAELPAEASTQPTALDAKTDAKIDAKPDAKPDAKTDEKPGARSSDKAARSKQRSRKPMVRGGDVRLVRGGRVKLDAMASRPSSRPSQSPRSGARSSDDAVRMMGSGRILMPTYAGLRGGSQLVRVTDDAWLGIGHEMKFVSGRKHYWHTWYLVDERGKMTAVSEPMKLARNGIEFAAGLAVDGDRVVISFGVDDMDCRLGETSLSAVMNVLQPFVR